MNSEKVKEIKKALKCCSTLMDNNATSEEQDNSCNECPYRLNDRCSWKLDSDALTLINELESKNESLILERKVLIGKKIAECPKTEESIVAPIYVLPNVESPEIMLKLGEKNLVHQFTERLKEKFYYVFGYEYEQSVSGFDTKILIKYIDETLKEFLL